MAMQRVWSPTRRTFVKVDPDNRPEDYALNHWRRFESPEDHAARVEAAEQEAGSFFDAATRRQKAISDQSLRDLRGLSGPKYDRARAASQAEWHRLTAEARELLYVSCNEIMENGEISPETLAEWDALIAKEERETK